MDLSTLITPVLQTITYLLPKDASSSSSSPIRIPSTDLSSITTTSSNSVAIDRALGTVASIGLTMAVYRLLSALLQNLRARNGDGDGDGEDAADCEGGEIPVSVYAIAEVLLQGLWAGGAAIPRTVLRTVGFEPTMAWRDDGSVKMRTYTGSCHCNSIRFRLRAPSHLSATDCQGKIRYPHIYTTASNFQLTSGTENLSVYYVKLPSFHPKQPATTKPSSIPASSSSSTSSSTSSSSDDDESTEKGNIAAHTFCNQCGVHILRAPDPKSNELEVNTDCLDVFYDRNGKSTSGAVTIDVRMEDEGNGRGLGGGRPMMIDRLTTVMDDDAENDDDGGEVDDDDDAVGGGGEGRGDNPMGGRGLGVGGKRVSARWGDWPNRQLSSVVDDDNDNDGDNEDKTESTIPHHNDRRRRARRPPRPPSTAVPRLDMSDTNSTDGISTPSVASSDLSSSDRKLDDCQAAVGISSANGTTASVTMTKTTTTSTPSSRKNSFSLGQGTFQVDDGIATTTPQQSPPSSSVALSQLEYYMRKHVTPPVSDAEE